MSRVVQELSIEAGDPAPRRYVARVWAEQADDGLWNGWIEFVPSDGGAPVHTERETTQSSLEQIEYWASGLTEPYLQMALERARAHTHP